MHKFLMGSKLLGLSNNSDTDYYVILEDGEKLNREIGVDYHVVDWQKRLKVLTFQDTNPNYCIFCYQHDKQINSSFAEFFEYNLLDYKKELIDLIDNIIKNKLLNFNNKITTTNNCCCKIIYHIAYNIFILENNSPIITAEQKEIIQKIHDRVMPIEYLDILKNKFYQIKEAYYGN